MKVITSKQNSIIKIYNKLRDNKRARYKHRLVVVEGERELRRSIASGYTIEMLLINDKTIPSWIPEGLRRNTIQINDTIERHISNRESPNRGVYGIVESPGVLNYKDLMEALRSRRGLYIILDGIVKPGNIGAIFRTARAFGVLGVIILQLQEDVDPFSPIAIRNSMGAVFFVPVYKINSSETEQLFSQDTDVFVTSLQGDSSRLSATKFVTCKNIMMVFGAEDDGVSSVWNRNDIKRIFIDMPGCIPSEDTHAEIGDIRGCDSLNVASSVAVCLFEVSRQYINHII